RSDPRERARRGRGGRAARRPRRRDGRRGERAGGRGAAVRDLDESPLDRPQAARVGEGPRDMKVRVRAFAVYRELLGRDALELELADGATPRAAFERVFASRSDLPRLLKATMFAVNEEYVAADATLNDGDELAFIPPV